MRKGKNAIRRMAALVCSVALLATLLPAQVLAADDVTSGPAVTLTTLNEGEEGSGQEDGNTQPEPEVSCTKSEDCQADTHEEGCPKNGAQDEEGTTEPEVSCTKSEDCQAKTHEEGCPKNEAQDEEGSTEPEVSCTKSEDCQADTHEEGCPKYEKPEEKEPSAPAVNGDETGNTPAEPQEEKPEYVEPVQEGSVDDGPNEKNKIETIPDAAPLSVTPAEVTVSNETDLREAIANAGTDVTTITVNGTIALSDAIQITGSKNLVLQGADASATITFAADLVVPSEAGVAQNFAMFQIANEAKVTITLKNIVLDGADKARLILLGTYNTLFIEEGAVLQNGYAYKPESASQGNSGGAVWVLAGSKVVMNGGMIQNCCATRYGGGIYGWAEGATVEMNGGTIANNKGGYAGGIALLGNSNLYLKGGTIRGNIGSTDHGDGVFISTGAHCYLSGNIEIYDNNINGNENTNRGIYLNINIDPINLMGPFTGRVNIVRAGTVSLGTAYVCGTEDYQITPEDAAHINILSTNRILSLEGNRLVVRTTDQVVQASFNANDDTDTPAVITCNMTKNTETSLPANVFEREGYIFKGWNTAADGSGTAYSDKASVTLTEAQTLYAQWMKTPELSVQMFGATQLEIDGVTLDNLVTADTDVLAIDGAEVSPKEDALGKTATIQATATGGGYTFPITLKATVVPRALTYVNKDNQPNPGSITYSYAAGHHKVEDYLTFVWADDHSTAVSLQEGTDIDYTYTVNDPQGQGGGAPQTYDYLPMPVGTYKNVRFNMRNKNYTFALSDTGTREYLEISVAVQQQNAQRAYLASAAPKANQNFFYTGKGVLPVEGTLNAYGENSISASTVGIGNFTVNIEGLNSTNFHSEVSGIVAGTDLSGISGLMLPTDPGTYIITASAANDNYYLYKSLVFTINKATVTITAADKTVIKGDTDGLPSLNDLTEGKDYTVTGLAAGHSLTTAPTLNYADGANVNTVATYSIVPSGAAADEKYYTIQYVNGTLHVEEIAIIEGADQTWTQGSGSDLVIRSNADFSDFVGVTVNGKTLVENQDYTARSGSTIVTIKAAYLESLAVGDYQIAIVSQTGTAATQFAVKATAAGDTGASDNTGTTSNADSTPAATRTPAPTAAPAPAATAAPAAASAAVIPQTGDTMPVGLLGGVAVIAAAAFVVLLVLRKRKDNH